MSGGLEYERAAHFWAEYLLGPGKSCAFFFSFLLNKNRCKKSRPEPTLPTKKRTMPTKKRTMPVNLKSIFRMNDADPSATTFPPNSAFNVSVVEIEGLIYNAPLGFSHPLENNKTMKCAFFLKKREMSMTLSSS